MVPPISVKCASLLTFAFMLIMIILNITFFEVPFFGISDDQRTREVIDVLSLAVASTSDKGMVMCVGNDDSLIAGALYNVEQLRETYNSALPVSINHCNELSSKTMSLFTHYKGVTIKNVCDRETPKQEQIRLRGWFCKTKALISSDFKETIVVDTDVLWFKDPSRLFHAPDYLKSGALFFRDRFLYESLTEKDGLEIDEVKRFIEVESGYAVKINSTVAKVLAESNGINFFWRNAQNSTKHRAIRHVQESSVIIFDKSRLKKTIEVLRRLLLTFRLGNYFPHRFMFLSNLQPTVLLLINCS